MYNNLFVPAVVYYIYGSASYNVYGLSGSAGDDGGNGGIIGFGGNKQQKSLH